MYVGGYTQAVFLGFKKLKVVLTLWVTSYIMYMVVRSLM